MIGGVGLPCPDKVQASASVEESISLRNSSRVARGRFNEGVLQKLWRDPDYIWKMPLCRCAAVPLCRCAAVPVLSTRVRLLS